MNASDHPANIVVDDMLLPHPHSPLPRDAAALYRYVPDMGGCIPVPAEPAVSGDDHGTTGELDLDAIEARATLILAEVNREHDWHNPHPGSNLRCRACGLWHGAWSGDGCPGADPEPLPNVSLGLETTLALVAEVRRLRDEAVDERTTHAKVVDNLVAEIERLRAHH